ncbi:MAG: TIGR01212 family radical SAM protein [Bacteroidales bacterium]|nr:TIGR01212 family radical SAM protein [Bacteroidales bacterium]
MMDTSQKPYRSYADYFKNIFGGRVQKISVNAGFTCPNRDGTKARGGCTYCDNDAFHPSYCKSQKPIIQQIEEGIEFHQKRYRRATQYLVYFQAYSNTYKPLSELKLLYESALQHPQVVGLVIGTRPDTVDAATLHYLAELQKRAYIMIEYGIESVYDQTLEKVNRGHTFAETRHAIEATHRAGLPCGGHLIFGLPGETREMMLAAANIISDLPLTTVKFHQLQIFKNTRMAQQYLNNPDHFHLFGLREYIDFIIDFAELLNPSIVIERFAGEVPPRFLVTPPWENVRYDVVLQRIEKRFGERGTFQGRLWPGKGVIF